MLLSTSRISATLSILSSTEAVGRYVPTYLVLHWNGEPHAELAFYFHQIIAVGKKCIYLELVIDIVSYFCTTFSGLAHYQEVCVQSVYKGDVWFYQTSTVPVARSAVTRTIICIRLDHGQIVMCAVHQLLRKRND